MLLPICGYKVIEAEFHHGDMDQVSRVNEFAHAMFLGNVGGNIKNLVVIDFKKTERTGLQMLFEQAQPRLMLGAGKHRLARRIFEQSFTAGHMQDFDFVKSGEKRGRLVVLQQGKGRLRVGFRPVEFKQKATVEVGPQKRSSLS